MPALVRRHAVHTFSVPGLGEATITPAAAGDVYLNHLNHSNSHTFLLGQETAVFADVHKNFLTLRSRPAHFVYAGSTSSAEESDC